MAEGTNVIATREYANNKKPGAYTSDLKRCVTYSSAISAGFAVRNADRYTSNTNRLVRLDDLYVPSTITFKLVIDISAEASLYNRGPITLNTVGQELKDIVAGSIGPVSYAREIEATEVEQDTPEYSNTADESNMNLSTLDEVLQVAQEFEEQENALGAGIINPNKLVQITLTKEGSTANLLDASTYGPVSVIPSSSSKTVTYTLHSKTYSSSYAGNYTLKYPGTKSNYLMNASNTYPEGGLYPSASSTGHSQTITVASGGTYTFNAVWRPTPTYTFRVRFSIDDLTSQGADIRFLEFSSFTGTIYSSGRKELAGFNLDTGEYDIRNLHNTNESNRVYYYIDVWTGKELPCYARVIMPMIIRCKENKAGYFEVLTRVENSNYNGSDISGTVFNTIDQGYYVYSIDLILYV